MPSTPPPPARPAKSYQLRVVAAVIERGDQVLVCQRKHDDSHPLKWEFPGGKVERGEPPRVALYRELREELGIRARIGEELARYSYQYPGKTPLLLMFFRVTQFRGEPENLTFEQITWAERQKLPDYDFLEGDHDFVVRLATGEYHPKAD